MLRWTGLAAAAFVMALSGAAPTAQAADIVGVYGTLDSICDHKNVRTTIQKRFRYQVTHVPNLPNVDIVDFLGASQTRYQPATAISPIERRYCRATARLSDGRDRSIWYVIEYGQGFASIGDNVEFCLSGFDRWNVYNGSCRVLR